MKKTKALPEELGNFPGNGSERITTKPAGPVLRAAGRVFKHPKSELEAAIQRYVDLFEFAPISYVSFDRVGHIEEINQAALQLLGRSRNRVIGEPFALHVTKEDAGLFLNHLLRCRASDTRVETELHLTKRNGEISLVHLISWPAVSVMRGGALLYQTAIVDFTDLKHAEEALRQSEERMRAIVEQATVGIARTDRQSRLLFVNKPFCAMLGYQESELIGQPIRMFTHEQEVARTAALFGRLIRQGRPYELEKRYVRKDGSIIWVNVSASPVRDLQGKVQSAVAVVVDITARKKAETELRRSKEMLETLVQQRTQALRAANTELKSEIERRKGLEGEILAVSDREQQRLGRELHDGLCQELTAVSLMAQSAALRLKQHRVVEVEDLETIAALIKNSVIDARNIARDLHKEEMNAAYFLRALHDLTERKIWSTPCRLKIATQFEIESDTVASELYRILREALVNVTKHARATEMSLEVCRKRNELIFSVTDNGIGLGARVQDGSGLGFHIMNYRAKSIGGRLEVKSLKSGGTRVSVHLPNGAHKAVGSRP